ncbi:MAG: hypothetical protein HY429_03795 [Candidatus Levybacteria bacterium]|nr:hypothetical protein [Candidatus Levybacteria bacterium]
MPLSDIFLVFQWWGMFAIIGLLFFPLANYLFPSFIDRGFVFAKVLGIILTSYIVFLLGTLRIMPFTQINVIVTIIGLSIALFFFLKGSLLLQQLKKSWWLIVLEELLFFATLLFWTYVRAHQPEIRGLEKFMDFGFVNSILRAEYFPPKDMWFTPFSINYYYFGHLTTAVLTKLIGIPSFVTYNLMLATLFAFTFTCSFSIGANLIHAISNIESRNSKRSQNKKRFENSNLFRASDFGFRILIGGLLTAFLVSLAGNLHTVYTFFKPYQTDNPLPITQLAFSPTSFPNSYWYPNATRFIYNTIHEFPIYSFVVADLHGHVLDIPTVLLTIAVLLSLINSKHKYRNSKQDQNTNDQKMKLFENFNFRNWNLFRISDFGFRILLLAFLLAVMYMTNIWDGIIYLLLVIVVCLYLNLKNVPFSALRFTVYTLILIVGFILFSLPFSLHFKPFASGIGVLCAPQFLTNIGRIGPFLFEADHCQKSPIWQLATLYGFFYFWVIAFFVFLLRKLREKTFMPSVQDLFVIMLICLSSILIVIPEFIYVKDIYPAHYRANTMFKLVYQAFIMLSIASAYSITRIITNYQFQISNFKYIRFIFFIFAILFFILVAIYPYFAITSYYGNLQTYQGLDGIRYLNAQYSDDHKAILWLNKNIAGQPVILEAQGDSYTDFARISANTGLPTVLGWTVHEWLWRGTYDIPSPRIAEVQTLYETTDIKEAKRLIDKYNIELILVGTLERQKYPSLQEEKFSAMGRIISKQGSTTIYKLTR